MNTIRRWTLEDAPSLVAAINNPKILNNLRDGIPYPYTDADARAFIQGILEAPKDSQYSFAIQASGIAVGSIGIFRQSNIHARSAELGYYLAEPYWGKGLVTKAVQEACAYVFAHTDILRIFAEPFAYNEASCRVLQKAGFSLEGTLRSHAIKNGQVLDMKLYARVR